MSFVALAVVMRVFLLGYMGVGKSTIGKKISSRLGLKFMDLDQVISSKENLKITQIIENKGEEYFRKLERETLKEVSNLDDVLIATGGGTPCFFDNIDWIKQVGTSVYLKLAEKVLIKRLSYNLESRPLLKGKNEIELTDFVNQHLKSREAFYKRADISFDTLNFDAERLEELVENIKDVSR
jgi:shikimate kinase